MTDVLGGSSGVGIFNWHIAIKQGRNISMDEQQKQNINQAAEQFTGSTQQAFRTIVDKTVCRPDSRPHGRLGDTPGFLAKQT